MFFIIKRLWEIRATYAVIIMMALVSKKYPDINDTIIIAMFVIGIVIQHYELKYERERDGEQGSKSQKVR